MTIPVRARRRLTATEPESALPGSASAMRDGRVALAGAWTLSYRPTGAAARRGTREAARTLAGALRHRARRTTNSDTRPSGTAMPPQTGRTRRITSSSRRWYLDVVWVPGCPAHASSTPHPTLALKVPTNGKNR